MLNKRTTRRRRRGVCERRREGGGEREGNGEGERAGADRGTCTMLAVPRPRSDTACGGRAARERARALAGQAGGRFGRLPTAARGLAVTSSAGPASAGPMSWLSLFSLRFSGP